MNKRVIGSWFAAWAMVGACATAQANALTLPFGTVRAAAQAMTPAYSATGYVTGVSDGDTFYMQIDGKGKAKRIRLAEVDAPESAQPFGRRAEQSLRELIGKQWVAISWRNLDRYKRPVAHVEVGGVNVNTEQVRRGFAWVSPQYSHDARLFALEAEARSARRGLWVDPNPVAPWVWRKSHKR